MSVTELFKGYEVENHEQTKERILSAIMEQRELEDNEIGRSKAEDYLLTLCGVYIEQDVHQSDESHGKKNGFYRVNAAYDGGNRVVEVGPLYDKKSAKMLAFNVRNIAGMSQVSDDPFLAIKPRYFKEAGHFEASVYLVNKQNNNNFSVFCNSKSEAQSLKQKANKVIKTDLGSGNEANRVIASVTPIGIDNSEIINPQ